MPGRPRAHLDVRCPPDHKHAERTTCYVKHKCRCAACREGAYRYALRQRKQKAYGRPTTNLVDAQPAREHLWDLRLLGMGVETIALRAGVREGQIRHILWRHGKFEPSKRVGSEVAAKILAVPLDPDLNGRLDPRGTIRRIQALAVQGWSLRLVSAHLGLCPSGAAKILDRAWVKPELRDRVSAVFAELWDQKPPVESWGDRVSYSKTRRWAASRGWVGPLSWDDIDHDDAPSDVAVGSDAEFVDELAVELACDGRPPRRLFHGEVRLVIAELYARQFSDRLIGEFAGVSQDTVMRIRRDELKLPAFAVAESVHRRVA